MVVVVVGTALEALEMVIVDVAVVLIVDVAVVVVVVVTGVSIREQMLAIEVVGSAMKQLKAEAGSTLDTTSRRLGMKPVLANVSKVGDPVISVLTVLCIVRDFTRIQKDATVLQDGVS